MLAIGDRVFVYGDHLVIGRVVEIEIETVFDDSANVVDSFPRFGVCVLASTNQVFRAGEVVWGIDEDFPRRVGSFTV